jgi:hypothetical protein
MRRLDCIDTHLLTEDDDGNEMELTATVHFQIHPAEPDVGYPREYTEVSHVSTWLEHFGEIIFNHSEEFEDQIQDAAGEALEL